MTRDRPAAGGQDSTLDGEFPGNIGGGGGGARVEPQKVAAPTGGYAYDSTFDQGTEELDVIYAYNFPYPIMRINDSVLGGDLSGVYQFNTPYILNYNNEAANTSGPFTSNATATTSTAISLTSSQYLGNMLFGLGEGTAVQPSGTGTIASTAITAQASLTGFSAGYYSTIYLPNINVQNKYSITSGQSLRRTIKKDPAPAFIIDRLGSAQRIEPIGFRRTPGGSGNLNLSISISGAGTGVSASFRAVGQYFTSFSTTAIISTLASSL